MSVMQVIDIATDLSAEFVVAEYFQLFSWLKPPYSDSY
jgi:hypothetical protein